jgi:hypothetical protein
MNTSKLRLAIDPVEQKRTIPPSRTAAGPRLLRHEVAPERGAMSSSVVTKQSPIASCTSAGQCAAGRARSGWPVPGGRRIGWMSGIRNLIYDLGEQLIGRR